MVRDPVTGMVSLICDAIPSCPRGSRMGLPPSSQNRKVKLAGAAPVFSNTIVVLQPAPSATCETVGLAVAPGGVVETVKVTGTASGLTLAPAALIVIDPVYVPTASPPGLANTFRVPGSALLS